MGQGHGAERLQTPDTGGMARCLNGKMEAGSGAGVGAELSSVSRVPRRGYISPPGVTRRSSIPTHTQ